MKYEDRYHVKPKNYIDLIFQDSFVKTRWLKSRAYFHVLPHFLAGSTSDAKKDDEVKRLPGGKVKKKVTFQVLYFPGPNLLKN